MRIISLQVLLIFILTSCQISFYFGDLLGDDCIEGYTELDKALIFRHEELRRSYFSGDLTEEELRVCGSVKYVAQEEEGKLYLTFFGTESAEDVYYGMIHWLEPAWSDVDSEIAVHAGFSRPLFAAAQHIRDDVDKYLSGSPASPEVFISGHSAGGVHGVLGAFLLSREYSAVQLPAIYCQSLGAPAAGNPSFAEAFDHEPRIIHNRYINGTDMMPGLLTEQMGYCHTGRSYHIGPLPNPLFATTSVWIIEYHFIEKYADSLR